MFCSDLYIPLVLKYAISKYKPYIFKLLSKFNNFVFFMKTERIKHDYYSFFLLNKLQYFFLRITVILEGALSIMVVIIGNVIDDPSSNPEQNYLHFTLC